MSDAGGFPPEPAQPGAVPMVARDPASSRAWPKTMFTTADNYVVKIHRRLEDHLLGLVVAAGLGVDTALKQDARGLS